MSIEEAAPVTRPFMMGPNGPSGPIPSDPGQPQAGYSVPGVLQFIKQEFGRFERERASWEVERAELQGKIAFLQGERKGHDNLMRDLVRRIKMLEFALKQERNKVYKLTHGTDSGLSLKPPQLDTETNVTEESSLPSLVNQKESRQILRDYLREVGFPDNVLEARVARLNLYRTLMSSSTNQNEPPLPPPAVEAPSETYSPKPPHPPESSTGGGSDIVPNGTDMQEQIGGRRDTEAESEDDAVKQVQNTFDFLSNEDSDDEDEETEWQQVATKDLFQGLENTTEPAGLDKGAIMDGDFVYEDRYSSKSDNPPDLPIGEEDNEWEFKRQVERYQEYKRSNKSKNISSRPPREQLRQLQQYANTNQPAEEMSSVMGLMGMPVRGHHDLEGVRVSPHRIPDERPEVSLGIGELVSIANPSDFIMNPSTSGSSKRWEHKYTMRNHYDAVTCVQFHPMDDMLVTGSEDATIKLWSIPKSSQKKSAIIDVEPAFTFRGHTGPVLSLAVSSDGEVVYSGSADGQLRMWQTPNDLSDPFDIYDLDIQKGVLEGHTDAIWGLVFNQSNGLLASASADGHCILWDPVNSSQIKSIVSEEALGSPTSIDFLHGESIVVSYSTAKVVVYDVETGKPVVTLDSALTYNGTPTTQINKVLSHPTLPIVITAHEDKYICFFDSKSGQVTHSMTAHMDAVTGLAIDPHGLYILSGSHDGSLRFWSMETKTCVQEITAHRKRFDESIYNVTCHLTKPFFASAGADGIAKVLL
ncbi:PREDICTED: striatin-3-like isoform X2 [Amphimedon queenslandica]|uniref:Striatin N-terminal domain-containing protein n=1 Tax=Amphimedon queenslandica TaxID=400682 RepID=A0AAN0JP59_AMPQE|nr:PREDICTED: striatin-3-like isoform X2 [Amphimedon queenslandica]|eukprot:XP_019858799.1 PREDICTED: striatin-3-like isoform X2 [Amphimedon queenslandica]